MHRYIYRHKGYRIVQQYLGLGIQKGIKSHRVYREAYICTNPMPDGAAGACQQTKKEHDSLDSCQTCPNPNSKALS